MTDKDVYRQRKQITPEELDPSEESRDPLKGVKDVQRAIAQETGRPVTEGLIKEEAPFAISGNIPPEFRAAIEARQGDRGDEIREQQRLSSGLETHVVQKPSKFAQQKAVPDTQAYRLTGSEQFETLLQRLADKHHWEEFDFPSKGKFYTDIPTTIHVRPMTGEEEQILATPRWVKRGKAMDMIFQRCIREKFDTENLLSIDRTHLLIYLRGISYTPEYDVEVRCRECGVKFSTVIDLNILEVTDCPDDFGISNLLGALPVSKFKYRYRLATGRDELEIANYRDKRIQQFGDQSEDDTLLFRTALLLEEIEGVTNKKEIQFLLKRLPINDVQHLRRQINEPPFGVDTEVHLLCPACSEEFPTDLPLEANFFFPRKKKEPEALQ